MTLFTDQRWYTRPLRVAPAEGHCIPHGSQPGLQLWLNHQRLHEVSSRAFFAQRDTSHSYTEIPLLSV